MSGAPAADLKRAAAEVAAERVESGMAVGLGSGTTAALAVQRLGERLAQGGLRDILGVATSGATASLAAKLGIPLADAEDLPDLDLTLDGADEVAPDGSLIKGGGGALLREKVVAQASRRVVIAVDASKLSERLGQRHWLPIAVMPFGWRGQARFLESLGAKARLRRGPGGEPFCTQDACLILDCDFGPIADPRGLADRLDARAGIAAHGLFLGLATNLVIAGPSGVEQRELVRA